MLLQRHPVSGKSWVRRRSSGAAPLQALCNKRFSDVENGLGNLDNLGNLGVVSFGMEQKVGMLDRRDGEFATADKISEERLLVDHIQARKM